MFNETEKSKIWTGLGMGFGIGIVICILLWIYEAFAEVFNCFCDFFGDSGTLPDVNSTGMTFIFVLLISTGIGLIIGIFMAMSNRSKRIEKAEAEEAKRVEIATNRRNADNHKAILNKANDLIGNAILASSLIGDQCNSVKYKENAIRNEMELLIKECVKQQNQIADTIGKCKDFN